MFILTPFIKYAACPNNKETYNKSQEYLFKMI